MDVLIVKNLEPNHDWINISGEYDQFHVYGDGDIHEDLVEYTATLLRKAAIKCLNYPFYIHFEGYEDEIDSILSNREAFEIDYQDSGRTVLTMSNGKTYNAEIPSFTVNIPNEDTLKKAFNKWFHLAQENCMWVMTQGSDIQYKNKFALIEMQQEALILLADHDAQSLSLITNHPDYRTEEQVQSIFKK